MALPQHNSIPQNGILHRHTSVPVAVTSTTSSTTSTVVHHGTKTSFLTDIIKHLLSFTPSSNDYHPNYRPWTTISNRSYYRNGGSTSSSSSWIACRSRVLMIPICLGFVLLCVSFVQFHVTITQQHHLTSTTSQLLQQVTTIPPPPYITSSTNNRKNNNDINNHHNNHNNAQPEFIRHPPPLQKQHPLSQKSIIPLPEVAVTVQPNPTTETNTAAISNQQRRVVYLQLPIVPASSWTHKLRQKQQLSQQQLLSTIRTPKPVLLPNYVDSIEAGPSVFEIGQPTDTASVNNKNNTTATDPFNRYKAIAMQQYLSQCVPMVSWHSQSYPSCNTFHEMDMIGSVPTTTTATSTTATLLDDDLPSPIQIMMDDDISLLSDQGSWRSVWKVRRKLWWNPSSLDHDANKNTTTYPTNEETMVLKLLKIPRRDFDEESYHHHRIDAMTMERLTSSTHIVNIYGYCGQSVLTEYAATSARSLTKDKSLSSLDRLKLGRDIVKALTHLHSIDYNNATNITMTHNDLNMANAVAIQQQIKLNDFNIGIIQRWNVSSQQVCKTPVLFEAPLWKSPEEIMASTAMKSIALDNVTLPALSMYDDHSGNSSSIIPDTLIDTSPYWVDAGPTDVFGLGNLLFQVLTKCQPWTHLELDGPKAPHDAAQRKVNGEQPYVPDKYHANTTSKVAYAVLHYAVLLCYQRIPEDRPTSYELLIKLNTAIEWIEDPMKFKKIRVSELRNLFFSQHSRE